MKPDVCTEKKRSCTSSGAYEAALTAWRASAAHPGREARFAARELWAAIVTSIRMVEGCAPEYVISAKSALRAGWVGSWALQGSSSSAAGRMTGRLLSR